MEYNNEYTWRLDQDNRRRAKEILVGAPVSDTYHENAYHDTREASKDEILARVRIVGVFKAAQEFRIRPKVIRRWLEKEGLSNNSMSNNSMSKKKNTPRESPQEAAGQKTIQDNVPQQVNIPLEDIEQKDAPQQTTAPQADTPQAPAHQPPASQTPPLKKSQDFSPEERKAIVARAKVVGTKKAAEEAGTTRFVVMSWERNDPEYKKFAGSTPAKATPAKAAPAKNMSTEVIPGTDGLPPRKEHMWEYSVEDRILLITKAGEVGNGPVVRAYGLHDYTISNWKRPLTEGSGQIAAPRKPAAGKLTAEKQTAEKQAAEKQAAEKQIAGKPRKQAMLATPIAILAKSSPEELTVSAPPIESSSAKITVIPGTDGLPPRKEHVWEYSVEERELILAKADEVGNGPVVRAYGLHSYTPRDWRRPGKSSPNRVAAPTQKAPEPKELTAPIMLGVHVEQPAASTTMDSTTPAAVPAHVHSAASADPATAVTQAQELAAPVATIPAPQSHEPPAPVPPAAPVAPAVPAAPMAPAISAASAAPLVSDTIELIRLKDRVALLEERIEKLRKVITDLI